jgi:CheY-like chemotaxis protein
MAKVLLVEDDPFVQRMYKRMFAHQNYDLSFASDGNQGITLAHEIKPELILLDIMMPGINGFEVLEKLKSDPETQNITVLILTNIGDDASIEKAKALGAAFYMIKADFSPEEVIDEVKKYLTVTS